MIRLLLWALQRMPRACAVALGAFFAWLAWVFGVRRRVALENLAIAFPELSARERRRLARANYLHLGRCGADFLRSPATSDERLFAMCEPGDWDKVEPYLRERKGFIVATAHMGNFELFGVYAARRGAPLTILTRELKGGANAQWVARRTLAGIKEIHKGMQNLVDSVNRGEVLALLIDQNMLLKRAVFAPFFGELAATTPAPAVVASRTGAPVFLGMMLRKPDGGYRTVFEGPFHFERRSEDLRKDVLEFTAMLNERFERHVRARPEQWFWVHRRWKTRLPEGARPEAPAEPAGGSVELTPLSNSR